MQGTAWDCIWLISIQISIDVWDRPEQSFQKERILAWGSLTPCQIAFYLNVNQQKNVNLGKFETESTVSISTLIDKIENWSGTAWDQIWMIYKEIQLES